MTVWALIRETNLPVAISLGFGISLLLYIAVKLSNLLPKSRLDAREPANHVSPAQQIFDDYAIKHIKWLCETSLDPAAIDLQKLLISRANELAIKNQGFLPFFNLFNELVPTITNIPRDSLHEMLLSEGYIDPEQAAKKFKIYIESYIKLNKLLVSCYDSQIRVLVQTLPYKAWRFHHNNLKRKMDDLAFDSKLEIIYKNFRCLRWPEE